MTVSTSKGKITATKPVLNAISIAFLDAAKNYKDVGLYELANYYDKVSEDIYRALKDKGYYDKLV